MFRRFERGICWLSVRCGGFDIFFKREERGTNTLVTTSFDDDDAKNAYLL